MREKRTTADDGGRWRTIAFVVLASSIVGCGPPESGDPHLAGSGATGKPTTVTPPSSNPAPMTNPPVVKTTAQPGDNPNRTHQLRTLKKVDMDLKGHPVHLWVMDDESKQQEGMMFLEDGDVKADEGMLFAFNNVQLGTGDRGFWMHNTLIPLDIVYLSPKGQVVSVAHGKVKDDTPLPAGGDFLNVIELKAGTAARFGLKAGDTVKISG